ncbi:MAG: aminotransferase class IV [Anaerolineales bacterium]|nr:aminotransferase class IV [Anaerolineales bacterium]
MTIQIFEIKAQANLALDLNAASLDGLTAQLPSGFYTTFSTLAQGTKVLGLKAHLQRLYLPAIANQLRVPVSVDELKRRIAALTKNNLPHESRVRLILTKDTGRLYLGIQPFERLPESVYQNGVKAITANTARHDPRIKDSDFITESAAQRKLLGKDIFEVLLTKDGKILEGMTSNFYAVKSGVIVTAQRGILLGVTRKALLRVAKGQGISIAYHAPSLEMNFDEALLTSSSRGVVPIISIDEKIIGQGRVGRISKQLSAGYAAYVAQKAEALI